ncbi:MAG: thioesterase family protein [Anaerolineales bacterium]|nr:thioesterase family protein [Anaerolineales bacterium]
MSIAQGLTMIKTFTVKEEHTAYHIGSGTVRVLGTPIMIAYMEITAMEMLEEHLDAAHTSVGTRVDVRHLAPSPLGAQIRVTAEVTGVDGPKITLKVEAWDGEKLIGTGTHGRYVINIQEFSRQIEL